MKIFTILMLIISAALLIPALLLWRGETGWLRSFDMAAYRDKKAYAKFLAKGVLMISASFLAAGLSSLLVPTGLSALILIAGFAASIRYLCRNAGDHYK